MRLFILTLFIAGISVMALAAEIAPTYPSVVGGRCIVWETIETGDTTAGGIWRGGKGTVEVNGTLANAELEIFYSRTPGSEISVDDDSAPDGLLFTSANGLGFSNIDLSAGSFVVNFASAGGATQDLDISICSIPQN